MIALATVPMLLGGFFIAWLTLGAEPFAAIPIDAIGMGLRYMTFPVMYGGRRFALLGGAFVVGAVGPARDDRPRFHQTRGRHNFVTAMAQRRF